MAKAATDEQVQLRRRARRRLIGAIALVTLIAVVLPWILESEPRTSDQDISIQIPSADSQAFNARVLPGKGVPSAKQPAGTPAPEASTQESQPPAEGGVLQAEQEKVLAPPATKSAPAKDKPAVKDAKSPPADSKKKAAEPREAPTDGKQFVVQIGALADASRAEAIHKALAAKGMKSYTEVVKTASGEVTRVRVGPFSSRDLAEQERAKLKALGYDGNVAPR